MAGQDPFLGEIALFPFTFAPPSWAWCLGQLMSISQNTALFSLLGTTYGGDGKSTFALPDLVGRTPLGWGQGPGLSLYDQGQVGGVAQVALLATEMPFHAHAVSAAPGAATTANPATAAPAETEAPVYHASGTPAGGLGAAGGGQPHNNLQPYLTLHYAIALQGIYPPRG